MKKLIVIIFALLIYNLTFNICNCEAQWVPCGISGMGIYGFDTIGSSIYIADFTGGILCSTNDGVNWSSLNVGINMAAFSVTHNKNYIFAGAYLSGVYRTSNNGINWTQVNSGLSTNPNSGVRSVIAIGNNIFAGYDDYDGVYRSTNNGDNWIRTDTNLRYLTYAFALNGQYLFAATANGVFRTSNNGINWENVTSGIMNYGAWSVSANGSIIYAAGSNGGGTGGAYISTNYGNSWNIMIPGIGSIFAFGNYLFAANFGNFFVSTDNGNSWINKNEGLIYVSVVSIFAYNNYSYTGGFSEPPNYTNILWRRPINELAKINKFAEKIPDDYFLSQNYPNPFNPATIIRFQIKDSRFVTLKVYDIIGREIETLVNENLKPGIYEVKFDGSKLASGIYFYTLTAGDFKSTKKLILLK